VLLDSRFFTACEDVLPSGTSFELGRRSWRERSPPFWRGTWLQIGPELLFGVGVDQVQGVELFSVAERFM
jgi:hypothetical protein